MHTLAERPRAPQSTTTARPARAVRSASSHAGGDHDHDHDHARAAGPARFGHDFGRFSITSTRPPSSASASTSHNPTAGDRPGAADELALGGDPAATATPAPAAAATIGGDATSISTSDLSAPAWTNNGEFKWWIKWVTDGTAGWIVQKIANTYSGTLANGSAVTNASVGVTPSYYEAWEVSAAGGITGSLGGTGNRDRWERPNLGTLGSVTNMSMTGTVYWTKKDPALSGFTSGGVGNAGSLLSSVSAPAGIGSPLLTRSAYGWWASSGAPMPIFCNTF